MDIRTIREIYRHLGDKISREIFLCRIMLLISEDPKWVYKLAETNPDIKAFFTRLKRETEVDRKIVVMGAGYRGKQLVKRYKEFNWICFIDNNPKETICEEIPVISAKEFLKKYENELIVIASRLHESKMYEQLLDIGVPEENIINYGRMLESLMHKQYFDLPNLPYSDEEIFVDLGCFDAMTDLELHRIIGRRLKKVIAFEPNPKQLAICKHNLQKIETDYELVEKGGWSRETILRFSKGTIDMGFSIDQAGEDAINVTSVDNVLNGEKATFIKMDIEGSEKEALIGCSQTIRQYSPKLAISVYHKLEDILEIPELILDFGINYKFYLRHYSPFETETVLYVISEE